MCDYVGIQPTRARVTTRFVTSHEALYTGNSQSLWCSISFPHTTVPMVLFNVALLPLISRHERTKLVSGADEDREDRDPLLPTGERRRAKIVPDADAGEDISRLSMSCSPAGTIWSQGEGIGMMKKSLWGILKLETLLNGTRSSKKCGDLHEIRNM